MGTTNFGDDVFLNPWPFVRDLYQLRQEREVVPEFELFDLGQVAALHRLLDLHGLPYGGKVHVDLVMGVPAACPARPTRSSPPSPPCPPRPRAGRPPASAARPWRSASPRCRKGGHLRVGMEDVLTLSRGVPVEHNEQLVSRAVEMGRLAQRTPMTPADARELLGLPPAVEQVALAAVVETRRPSVEQVALARVEIGPAERVRPPERPVGPPRSTPRLGVQCVASVQHPPVRDHLPERPGSREV